MKSFIVRIYRYDRNNAEHLVGIVEETGKEGRCTFNSIEELWSILSSLSFQEEDRDNELE